MREAENEKQQPECLEHSSRLDAIKRLRVPKRPRAQSYSTTIDGVNAERNVVAWYWRLLALASSFMILGGYDNIAYDLFGVAANCQSGF